MKRTQENLFGVRDSNEIEKRRYSWENKTWHFI